MSLPSSPHRIWIRESVKHNALILKKIRIRNEKNTDPGGKEPWKDEGLIHK